MRITFKIGVLGTDLLAPIPGEGRGRATANGTESSRSQGLIVKSNIQDFGIPEEKEGAEKEKIDR